MMGKPDLDLESYVMELERELDAAKAKYNAIYDSVRSVDRFIDNIKSRHKHIYSAAKNIHDRTQRRKPVLNDAATHLPKVNPGPLKMILVNDNIPRLNLIFDDTIDADILAIVTKFVNKNNFELRIITRNNLVNPKVYRDILNNKGITAPKSYSFYSDVESRLAAPIHRLEVSKNDVFVAATRSGKDLIKQLNLPTPKGIKL